MVSDVHNCPLFLGCLRHLALVGDLAHTAETSQLPSSKATLVVALAISDSFISTSLPLVHVSFADLLSLSDFVVVTLSRNRICGGRVWVCGNRHKWPWLLSSFT